MAEKRIWGSSALAVQASPAWCESSTLLRMVREAQEERDARIEQEEDGCSEVVLRISRELPLLNLAIGLRSTAYVEEDYLDMLRACAEAYAQRADTLERACAAREGAGMRLEAHALAGSLSSIGAEQLGKHAAELEMAIYDGNAVQVRIQTPPFLAELRDFIEQLRRFFADRDAEAPSLVDYPPLWRDTAQALRRCVQACDYAGALELLRMLEWAHAPEDGPWLTATRRALESFDYTALQELMRRLPDAE